MTNKDLKAWTAAKRARDAAEAAGLKILAAYHDANMRDIEKRS